MVELIVLFVLLVAINEGIGEDVPDEVLNPIAELFVPLQEKEVPVPEFGELAVKLMELTVPPAQVKILGIVLLTGFGFIVIV